MRIMRIESALLLEVADGGSLPDAPYFASNC